MKIKTISICSVVVWFSLLDLLLTGCHGIALTDHTQGHWFRGRYPGRFSLEVTKKGSVSPSSVQSDVYINGVCYEMNGSEFGFWNFKPSIDIHDCQTGVEYFFLVRYTPNNIFSGEGTERLPSGSTPKHIDLDYPDEIWDADRRVNEIIQLGSYYKPGSPPSAPPEFTSIVRVKIRRPGGDTVIVRDVSMIADEDSPPNTDFLIEAPWSPPLSLNCGDYIWFRVTYMPGFNQTVSYPFFDKGTIGVSIDYSDGIKHNLKIQVHAVAQHNPQ